MLGFSKVEKEHAKLKEDFAYTQKLLKDMRVAKEELNTEIRGYRSTISEFAAEKSAYVKEIQDLKQKLSTHEDVASIKLANVEKSVNQRVNETLATIGVKNFAVIETTSYSVMSPQEHLNKFQSLSGGEKTEYYNKYSIEINCAMNT